MSIPAIPEPCIVRAIPTLLTFPFPRSFDGYFSSHFIISLPFLIHSSKLALFIDLSYAKVVSPSFTIFLSLNSTGSMFNLAANLFIVDSTAKHP